MLPGKAARCGGLLELGNADLVMTGFESQEDLGFTENVYNDEWFLKELAGMTGCRGSVTVQ